MHRHKWTLCTFLIASLFVVAIILALQSSSFFSFSTWGRFIKLDKLKRYFVVLLKSEEEGMWTIGKNKNENVVKLLTMNSRWKKESKLSNVYLNWKIEHNNRLKEIVSLSNNQWMIDNTQVELYKKSHTALSDYGFKR